MKPSSTSGVALPDQESPDATSRSEPGVSVFLTEALGFSVLLSIPFTILWVRVLMHWPELGLGVVGIAALLTLFLPVFSALMGQPFRFLHAAPLVLGYAAVTVFYRGMTLLLEGSVITDAVWSQGAVGLRGLVCDALWMTCGFLLLFYGGVHAAMRQGRRRVSSVQERSAPRSAHVLAAASLVGLIGLVAILLLRQRIGDDVDAGAYVAATREGGVYWLMAMARFLSIGALSLLGLILLQKRSAAWVVGGCALVWGVSILQFLVFPGKGIVLHSVLATFILYDQLRSRVRIKTLLLIGLLLLASYPPLLAYRSFGADVTVIVRYSLDAWADPSTLLSALMARFYGADSLVMILNTTPDIVDYRYGETLGEAFWWFIPRDLWPGKPLSFAVHFGQEYMPSAFVAGLLGVSPTLPGELFINFGLLGVLAGGLGIGWLFGTMDRWLTSPQAGFVWRIARAYLLWVLVASFEGPLVDHAANTFLVLAQFLGMGILLRVVIASSVVRAPVTS